MPRYRLTLEYHGAPYAGWQRQDGQPTVQAALEEALFAFCGERAEVVGAGRTDAGVHALGQVAHVELQREWDPFRIVQGVNFHLAGQQQTGIAVLAAEEVPADFHARFSATSRRYIYRILNRRARPAVENGLVWHVPLTLDAEAMQEAANRLLGQHDFTSFRDSECQAKSPVKTLDVLTVRRVAGEIIEVETRARSFLHHQVRIMTGTLVQAGLGKWSAEDVSAALEARDRRAAGPTAPAEGLYLVEVTY